MTPWRRRARRARMTLLLGLAGLVIAGAVLMGVVQLLLPFATRHPERVAAFLSERVHRPVSIDSVEAQWEGAGPVLRLHGVHIAGATADQPPLVIPQAQLAVDFSTWAKKNRRWNEFRLSGLDLHLERTAEGGWSLRGFATGGGDGDGGDNPLLSLGAVVVSDSQISVTDATRGLDVSVHADELRLLNWGDDHTVLGLVRHRRDPSDLFQLVARWNGESGAADIYIGSEHADLAQVLHSISFENNSLRRGNGRVRLWASVRDSHLDSVHAAFDVADIAVSDDDDPSLAALPGFGELKRLSGVARWQRAADGWSVDVAQLRASGNGAVSGEPTAFHFARVEESPERVRYDITAPQWNLADTSRLAVLADALPLDLRRWLFEAAPEGALRDVAASYVDGDDYRFAGDLRGFSLKPSGKKPGLDRLDAHLLGDAQSLLVSLPDQATTLRMPALFRKPFAMARLGGDVVAYRADSGNWRIETEALAFEGEEFGGEAAGSAELPREGGRPILDLGATITHAEVSAAKLFWPIGTMPPPAMTWLDRALVTGRVTHGRAVIRGNLADWPFRNNEGRFDALADIDGLTLDYHPEWPRGEDIHLTAQFTDNGMHVEADRLRALGAEVERGIGDIADFAHATVDLDIHGGGTGPQLLAFLNASPVGRRYADVLQSIKVGGKGAVDFTLSLPLGNDRGDPTLAGTVTLNDADLDDAQYKIHFDKANGEVKFGGHGFVAGPLQVSYAGYPAEFSMKSGDGVDDKAHSLEATLRGELPLPTLFADVPALNSLWAYFSGASMWDVQLAVDNAEGVAKPKTELRLASDLQGTKIALPAPLTKAADATLPVRIALPLPMEGAQLDVAMGEVLRLRARLPDATRPLALGVAFGTEPPAQLPADGIAVTGRAARLDLAGWIGVSAAGEGGSSLRSVDIGIDEAAVGERAFHDLGLRMDPQPQQTVIALSGPEVQGTLTIPAGAAMKQQGIAAEFERLYWPAPPESEDEDAPGALSGVAPTLIPPMHVHIADLRLGHGSFGDARMEATPTPQGLHFNEVVTKSPNVEMRAKGDWIGGVLGSRSDFAIELSAQNLGRMLDALGYAGVVDGGETHAQIQASWPGSPSQFALSQLNGTLKLSVSEGRILEVEPGMGRLLGLFSLREIPRRLALDFGDFFRTGFTFKSISGEFALREGSAFTTDLHINSPSADIRINGRTGLKSKDYDQQMVVVPHIGGTLPVVGAVVAGPAGAAAGLAVQTLFNKAINNVTTARYHVGGSWEKPVITLVSREGGRRNATPAAPAKPKDG